MAYEDDIKKMYDEYYKSQYGQLVNNKNNALNGLTTQENTYNANYANEEASINKNKADTANRYKGMYTQLDNQKIEGKNKYYNDRNQASLDQARNNQAIRDYMARNNLLASGESVDAMLNSNTDFNNTMGGIYGAEQNFNKGIEDTRGRYQGEEASAYTGYDNDLAAALRVRDNGLNDISRQRTGVETTFNGDNTALLGEINYKKIQDINAYKERLRQEAWQAEQDKIAWDRQQQAAREAAARSSSYTSNSGYSNFEDEANANMKQMNTEFSSYIKAGDTRNARDILFSALRAYQAGLITGSDYMGMQNQLTQLEDEQAAKATEAKKAAGKTLTYGYRNGKAGYY